MRKMSRRLLFFACFTLIAFSIVRSEDKKGDEEEDEPDYEKGKPVIDPTLCEVCKYLVVELQTRLDETGRNKEVLRLGHGLEGKKAVKYNKGELRLIEAMQDPHICQRIIEYSVHKERKGSLRFAKGRSETMQTLHNLVDKGVKVTLDYPYEMWDNPPAEVTMMQQKCYKMVEDYEDDIEDWYYNYQKQNLLEYLCRERVLKNKKQKCLDEVFVPKEDDDDADEEKKEEDTPKKEESEQEKNDNKDVKGEKGVPSSSDKPKEEL